MKFLEKAKSIQAPDGKQMQFPFVMTIDPVREAHEAIAEAGKELLNKGTEHNANRIRSFFGQAPRKVYPPLVRSRSQPESLYKPGNTGKFINFYQKNDTLGLKMGTRFGIQGSPVEGAKNSEIFNLSDSGHGEISYQPQVTEAFTRNLKALLDPK